MLLFAYTDVYISFFFKALNKKNSDFVVLSFGNGIRKLNIFNFLIFYIFVYPLINEILLNIIVFVMSAIVSIKSSCAYMECKFWMMYFNKNFIQSKCLWWIFRNMIRQISLKYNKAINSSKLYLIINPLIAYLARYLG